MRSEVLIIGVTGGRKGVVWVFSAEERPVEDPDPS